MLVMVKVIDGEYYVGSDKISCESNISAYIDVSHGVSVQIQLIAFHKRFYMFWCNHFQ
jgi:hypothetical protein